MAPLHVLLVDPSLFTAPYDAALTQGLLAAGVQPTWATRPLRRGDRAEIPPRFTDDFFYRRVESVERMPAAVRPLVKGWAHVAGMLRLLQKVRREKPDVVHVQWVVVPVIDALAMSLIRRWCALVLTVHDTVAWNAEKLSWLQRLGHRLPARLAHEVIVHTAAGRETLLKAGVPAARVSVIPHGPLRLACEIAPPAVRDPRWTVVLFGEIKPYKGLDVLIEAVAALSPELRRQLRVTVAGRPRMDMAPLATRIAALGLGAQFELRLRRLPEEEMAALFAQADCFVFPYRQIDASGVYYLVKPLGKWLIASRVGIFAEEMSRQALGALVPPGDVRSLALALQHAIEERPSPAPAAPGPSWSGIGVATRARYERSRLQFKAA